jgi:hypothetical protein
MMHARAHDLRGGGGYTNMCSRAPRTERALNQRKDGWVSVRQAQGSLPVRVRSGEMPGSLVAKLPCVAERRGAKRGGATGRSAASSEACGVVNVHRPLGRPKRSRARVNRVKAMERVWEPGAGAEEPLGVWGVERSDGCSGNWGDPPWPSPCGGREQRRGISGDPAKSSAAKRESEGVVVVVMVRTTQPGRSEGPLLHPRTAMNGRDADECRHGG